MLAVVATGVATYIGRQVRIRLVQTACKVLSKHGSKQSVVATYIYQPFTAYLSSNYISKNPLASFRGNQFNILFYDAAVYHISPLIEKFFIEI